MPSPDDDDIPVADPLPVADPMPVADPVPPAADLPVAVPVAVPASPVRASSTPHRELPVERPHSRTVAKDVVADTPPPKPRYFTACCSLGCLGAATVGGIGFLVFVAITILAQLGNQIAKQNPSDAGQSTRGQRPGPIQPTRLNVNKSTITLPGPVTAIGHGGNGRYLLLRTTGLIAVFDPNTGELGTPFMFPTSDNNLVFAAGASRIFVQRMGALERYNLESRQLEHTVPWINRSSALAIGYAADGPLLAFTLRADDTEISVIDTDRLEETSQKPLTRTRVTGGGIRVSGDGRLIGIGSENRTRGGLLLRSPTSGVAPDPLILGRDLPYGHVAPSPDGRFVFTSQGAFDADGNLAIAPEGKFFYLIPPAHGSDFFLSLEVSNAGVIRSKVRVHLADERNPLGEIPNVVGPIGLSADDLETLPADRRVHFWPSAGLVAVLRSPTELDVFKVDVAAILRNSGQAYLAFASDPPTTAVAGETYRYRLQVWSNDDQDVEYQLKQHPDGMRLINGELVWNPSSASTEEVELIARSGSRTARQLFRIVVNEP